MRKKLLTMILAGCMVLSMTACGDKTEDDSKKDQVEDQEDGSSEEGDTSALGTSTLVELAEYKGLTYQPYDTTVTDEEVQLEVDYMVSANPNKESQEVVGEDSIVVIDYVGKKDDVAFEGGTAENQELDIANNSYIEGFSDSIIGMKVGETKDCPMTFPEDYHAEELAGADVVFTITVKECWAQTPAELNDEFAVSQGYENVDDLYAKVRVSCEEYKKQQGDYDIKSQLLQTLMDNSSFEINDDEVTIYADQMMSYNESLAASYGLDMENYVAMYGMTMEQFEEDCKERALYQIKAPLVQFAIAEKENLEITEEEYLAGAQEYMGTYGYTDLESFEAAYEKEMIKKQLLANKALDFVVENAVAGE